MASPDFTDPYLDPATGILRNKVGARTQAELDEAESDASALRRAQLLTTPPNPTGDLGELCAIHRHLFQGVYDWAGQVRTVDVRKNVDGADFFLPFSRISSGAGFAAEELRNDHYLRGLVREQFIERISYHYDQFNYVHPFREGNGRTQRVFWDPIARVAGWELDWRSVHGSTNVAACRAAAERRDFAPLHAMSDQIVTRLGHRDSTGKRDGTRAGDEDTLREHLRTQATTMRATRASAGLPPDTNITYEPPGRGYTPRPGPDEPT